MTNYGYDMAILVPFIEDGTLVELVRLAREKGAP